MFVRDLDCSAYMRSDGIRHCHRRPRISSTAIIFDKNVCLVFLHLPFALSTFHLCLRHKESYKNSGSRSATHHFIDPTLSIYDSGYDPSYLTFTVTFF